MKVKPTEAGYTPAKKEDYGPTDVECPVCGTMDNHARGRRGLCIWCACALALEVGESEFVSMPKDKLVRMAKDARERAALKGRAPKITRRNEWTKR